MSILSRNNHEAPDPDEQLDRSMELEGIRQTNSTQTGLHEDILRYLGESDIDDDIKDEFRSLISKDWVLANLDDAGYQEIKWELRHLKHTLYDSYPGPDCLIVGDLRSGVLDDPDDKKEPLTDDDKKEIEELFRTIRMRCTRSKGMQQQRVLRTDITQSEVLRSNEDNGKWLGKLRR